MRNLLDDMPPRLPTSYDRELKLRAALMSHADMVQRLARARTEVCVLVFELLRGGITDARRAAIAKLAGELSDIGRPGVDPADTLHLAELRKEFGL